MKKNYVPYHIHTMLSNGITNIDSVSTYSDYVEIAKEFGMKAFAFSEHGSVLSWVKKKLAIEKAGMKYIHAEEFYLTSKISKDEEGNLELIRDNYHCVLIAKNYEGVKELNKLSSKSFYRDGHFYYSPRITFDELENTSDNIIITTACVASPLSKGEELVKKRFLKFLIKNKHRCFLEVQHHLDEYQCQYNKLLAEISVRYNIPLIAGTDSHAAKEEQVIGRSIMQKSKGVHFDNEDSWDLVFRNYDELVEAYKKQNALPEELYLQAINNTNVMADMIEEFELDYTKKYPVLYDDSLKALKEKIGKGIINRGVNQLSNYEEYKKKIAYELKTYIHNGAVDFLLLEEDYKNAMKKKGIKFGYSRGSVSGSVIAYLIGITEVDSLKYNLNFERFMNTERISLADVDTDWFDTDRDEVRKYLFDKQGLYCCNIITFNTIKMRGAIKDIGRALNYTPDESQALSDMVEEDDDKNEFIADKIREKHKKLFDYVDMVNGTVTSLGRHAAGLVVSPIDVEEAFGTLYISSSDKPISQINMKEIDSLNYVKLDILGLDCVGLISKTCELANIDYLTPDNTDYNDMNVWRDIAKDTTMIFQFESGYASDYLKQVLNENTIANIKKSNPNFSYIDLMSMANGAIRPAGASYRDELSQGIFRDNGNKELNEFLSPTLGYLVYQEQIIEFLHKFCGFTMGEGDIVRRGFAKKIGTDQYIPIIKDGGYLTDDKSHYIKGFIQTMKDEYNVSNEESEKIIESFLQVIIDASDYLFSYNHALPYSFLGFAVGYLRYYYPLETYTTALNIYQSNKEKLVAITNYVKAHNVKIESIQFGKSGADYTMDKSNNIIFKGIASIKDCNSQIASELLDVYKNIHDREHTFIDLLDEIKGTSVKISQLKILTTLNFFSEYGNNAYLLNIIKLYTGVKEKNKKTKKDKTLLPSIRDCKQLNKNNIEIYEKFGLTEYLIHKYSNNETAKQFRDIDNIGLLNEMIERIPNKPLSIIEQCKAEKEYLRYVIYTNPKLSEFYYIVVDYMTYQDETKPRMVLRNLKTGEEISTRIKQGKIYRNNPFGLYSILEIEGFTWDYKKKCIAGEWQTTDELEPILEEYDVIKNDEKME